MPHFRERVSENRDRLVALRFTKSELLALDKMLGSNESRTEFIVTAIEAYKLKREKRKSRR